MNYVAFESVIGKLPETMLLVTPGQALVMDGNRGCVTSIGKQVLSCGWLMSRSGWFVWHMKSVRG